MRKAKEPKATLTVQARENLSAQIESQTAYREAVTRQDMPAGLTSPTGDIGFSRQVDTSALDASISHQKRILAEGTPEPVSGNERARLEKEAKEDAEYLSKHLLTHKEMDLMPKHGYEYSRAVRKSIAHEVGCPETQRRAFRYRSNMARLDPENPEAQSIEALRRDS